LLVLCGPIGVYEEDAYPFLIAETAAIRGRVMQARPTLGICLGAQLMAKALGAMVKPGPVKEIGWAPVELTAAGYASPLRHLDRIHVLHWHGDNTVRLAPEMVFEMAWRCNKPCLKTLFKEQEHPATR
jgi:GMP synthase (glutamine-hydrolysing)